MSLRGMICPVLLLGLVGPMAPGVQGQGRGEIAGRVSSTILDPAGEPVSGVAIRIPSMGAAVLSETTGRFTLGGVPVGRHEVVAELIGCLLGREWVEVRAGERATVDFVVREPVIRLPGVVVRRTEEEGRVDAFSVGRMELDGRRPTRTLADLIRGEFPGVRVVQGSGLPGSEGAIQLRGPRSLSTEGQPLVVVDGMIAAGGFIDLNMEDVEAVTILKGAAAAAEYGARGQAGVIQISTRQGVRTGAGAAGPLVVVDGALAPGGVEGLEPSGIRSTDLVVGAAAGVLLGRPGVEGGVVSVTTAGGSPGEPGEVARCAGLEP
jgi:TonB-dependent SusC/RagA subfamily outer membrane receptor